MDISIINIYIKIQPSNLDSSWENNLSLREVSYRQTEVYLKLESRPSSTNIYITKYYHSIFQHVSGVYSLVSQ